MAKRFDIAARHAPADGDAWRVSLRHVALLLLVGLAIFGAIYWLESSRDAGAQAISLGGEPLGPGPKVGEIAPQFTLMNQSGETVSLEGLRGKPVLVNFWATWCPPCRAEMPDLDAVAQAHADTGLVVLAVNLQEDPTVVNNYLRTLGVRLHALLDPTGQVFRFYRINGLPTTVSVDRSGVVREIHVGPLSKDAIEARVAKIA